MKVWTSHIPIWSSSIGLQKKSPFTPFLTLSIEEIFESGFLNKIITKHFQRDNNVECLKKDDDTKNIIGTQETYFSFHNFNDRHDNCYIVFMCRKVMPIMYIIHEEEQT